MIGQDYKQRIEEIRRGEVPDGYTHTRVGVFPTDWQETRVIDRFDRVTRKNDENNKNVLTISAQQGLISQGDYYDKEIASEDKSTYYLMEKGDFAYNKSYSSGYPFGAIKRLEAFEKGIVSPLYICFAPKKETDSDFYRFYFDSGLFNREIYRIAQEGARNHGLLNVATEDFFGATLIDLPKDEQKKIAQILDACDRVIELKQKLVDELKKLKKVCLAKMFPQEGEAVPEIRFSDFTGSWDYYKLSRLMDFSNGFNGDASLYGRGIPYISVVDILNNKYITYQCIQGKVDIDEKSITKYAVGYGDVLFQRSSENAEEAGSSNVYISDQTVAFGGFVIRGKRKAEYDAYYMKSVLDSSAIRSQIVSRAQGAQHINISQETLMGVHINIPSLDEQKKIGRFFLDTDDLIALYQKELEEEQRKKKALMQLLLTGIVRV